MNEIFNKKINDTEVELDEDTNSCFFCDKPATETRRLAVDEDSGIADHDLCWEHASDFDNREGLFDPFANIE